MLPRPCHAWYIECNLNDNAEREGQTESTRRTGRLMGRVWSHCSHRLACLQPQACLGRVLFDRPRLKGDFVGGITEWKGDTQS